MLNAIHQREYGERLQSYPRITQLLKSYGATYERNVASVFQKKDIENYLSLSENTPFVLVRKAIIAISLSGGLRCAEIRELSFENIKEKGDVYEVTFVRKKQSGEKKHQHLPFLHPLLLTRGIT